jgi:hypothetical protein
VEEKLECRANAVIRGRVLYGSIHISDGAKIEAQCTQRGAATAFVAGAAGDDVGLVSQLLATRDVTNKINE